MGQEDNLAEELPSEEEAPEPSLRDSLEESIESIQNDETKEKSVSKDGLLPDDEKPALPEEKPAEELEKPAEESPGDAEEGKPAEEDGKPAEEDAALSKAPVGWDPKAREAWNGVPKEVKAMVMKREREVDEVLRQSSFARETHGFIDNLQKSYAPILAAEGVKNPLAAIQGLFQTVAELRMGSPEQKAQRMAQMIGHYGIDIQALDSALVGDPAKPSEQSAMEHMIDQRMQPVNQLLGELQNRHSQGQQQAQVSAEAEVAQFQGEFLSDVRNDMADLIDMAASRGQAITLQDAYDKAILLRPEIQSVLTQRASDAAILGNKESLAGKRNAASSISGRQIGDGKGGGAMSMRDSIAGAWEASEDKI